MLFSKLTIWIGAADRATSLNPMISEKYTDTSSNVSASICRPAMRLSATERGSI